MSKSSRKSKSKEKEEVIKGSWGTFDMRPPSPESEMEFYRRTGNGPVVMTVRRPEPPKK